MTSFTVLDAMNGLHILYQLVSERLAALKIDHDQGDHVKQRQVKIGTL
jgi:hypothetical protein